MTKTILLIALLLCAVPASAQFTSPTWCFDFEESAGASRTSTVGSITLTDNGTVGTTTGKSGAAATFNGSSQWLSATDAAFGVPLSVSDADFSFGVIANLQSTSGDIPIFEKDDTFPPYAILYHNAAAADQMTAYGYFNNYSTQSIGATSGWHFILGVYDTTNDRMGVSVDGAAFTYAAFGGFRTADDTADFLVGRAINSTAGAGYFTGYVDTLAMWKGTLLSDANATTFYNSGNGLSCAQVQAGGASSSGPPIGTLNLLGVGR